MFQPRGYLIGAQVSFPMQPLPRRQWHGPAVRCHSSHPFGLVSFNSRSIKLIVQNITPKPLAMNALEYAGTIAKVLEES